MPKNLTTKQQKFLELRLEKGLKGAEAYRQAYGSKMPPPLCAKQGHPLVAQPPIEKLNRMFGWVIDKSEIGKPDDFAHLTDEEVDAALMAELRARGLSERQARALLESDQSHEKSRSRRPLG